MKRVDTETALNSVTNIGYAVNGCYDRLYRYYFAGNYATSFGDIASDITYWNGKNSHFTNIYQFSPVTTDTYLRDIWNYGYKVIDNSSRAIVAGEAMMDNVSEEEKADLEMYLAEAYALRAYGHFVLVNIFGHQIKVNGQDFSSQPGIVVVESPVVAGSQVSRATVGETYASIVSDLKKSILNFESAGQSKGIGTYFNLQPSTDSFRAYISTWRISANPSLKPMLPSPRPESLLSPTLLLPTRLSIMAKRKQ